MTSRFLQWKHTCFKVCILTEVEFPQISEGWISSWKLFCSSMFWRNTCLQGHDVPSTPCGFWLIPLSIDIDRALTWTTASQVSYRSSSVSLLLKHQVPIVAHIIKGAEVNGAFTQLWRWMTIPQHPLTFGIVSIAWISGQCLWNCRLSGGSKEL